MLLLRTIHGSGLYGLAHSGSDVDYFEVHGPGKFKTTHTVKDGYDLTVMSLDTFMRQSANGRPQALEAMWSGKAEVDLIPWRFNFTPDRATMEDAYTRTIKNFSLSPDRKRRRHAWRLKLNYSDFINYGRFNPTLSSSQIDTINFMTDSYVSPT